MKSDKKKINMKNILITFQVHKFVIKKNITQLFLKIILKIWFSRTILENLPTQTLNQPSIFFQKFRYFSSGGFIIVWCLVALQIIALMHTSMQKNYQFTIQWLIEFEMIIL